MDYLRYIDFCKLVYIFLLFLEIADLAADKNILGKNEKAQMTLWDL